MSVVLLLLEFSVGVGCGWGVFRPLVYFCMFLLSVYGAVAPRFSAIVKADIFIFCRDILSTVARVNFVKFYFLQFCEVLAGFLGVVVGWVGLLSLCSLPFLRGWMDSLDREPPHKTENEAQPPHKQKSETYRSTQVGAKKPHPTPLQRRAPKAAEQRTQAVLHRPHT